MKVKLCYWLQGKYRSVLQGEVKDWQDGVIHFLDENRRTFVISEDKLEWIKRLNSKKTPNNFLVITEQVSIDDLDDV